MPRPPGLPKTGGRAKGTANKPKAELRAKAEELGVDPFEILLLFAANRWEELGYPSRTIATEMPGGVVNVSDVVSPELRVQSARDASKYIYPQLKAIEHTGAGGGPIEHSSPLTNEERLQLLQSLRSEK